MLATAVAVAVIVELALEIACCCRQTPRSAVIVFATRCERVGIGLKLSLPSKCAGWLLAKPHSPDGLQPFCLSVQTNCERRTDTL